MTDNKIARELLIIAKDDYASCDGLASIGIGHRVSCFLAQQTVEKCFKAVLAHRGHEFPHTHNLVTLARLLTDNHIHVPLTETALDELNPFAVLVRYGVYEEEYPKQGLILGYARDALHWCEEILHAD